MLDEENSRLRGLLIATTIAYILGWIVGLGLNRLINSEEYILWAVESSWVLYLTWLFVFIGFCWMPLTVFLLAQGIILRRKYARQSFAGDRTIGNLSIVAPLFFIAVYVFTRFIYGS